MQSQFRKFYKGKKNKKLQLLLRKIKLTEDKSQVQENTIGKFSR